MSLIWTQATLEPKRKFRYIVTFAGLADFQFLAQTCDRPGIKIGQSEHKYFDKSYFHPGRVSWDPNPLSIKVVDIQKNQGSNIDTNFSLMEVLAKSGLSGLINQNAAVQTIGKKQAVNALGNVTIQVLNADVNGSDPRQLTAIDGVDLGKGVAEEWRLKNAWLESFKPDALDYGAEDILTVTLTVRYDWAELFVDNATANPYERSADGTAGGTGAGGAGGGTGGGTGGR